MSISKPVSAVYHVGNFFGRQALPFAAICDCYQIEFDSGGGIIANASPKSQ
jgi:hypothetical protein